MRSQTSCGRAVTGDLRWDPCSIEGAVTSEHNLILRVLYVGGCRTHHFDILEKKVSRRAEFVVIDLLLAHDAQDDDCKALVREELIFDISALEAEHNSDLASGQLRLRVQAGNSTQLYEV